MNIEATPADTVTTGTAFIRLSLGKTRILLRQDEVFSSVSADAVRFSDSANDACGHITINNKTIPVYILDEDLRLTSVMTNPHGVCVCLGNGNDRIGILCDDAVKIITSDIELHELPDCMLEATVAIQYIGVCNNNIYCISNTARLLRLAGYSAQD